MKKINLLFLMLLISAYSFSQVTISAADNCFNIGDNVSYFTVFGADNFDPGIEGADVVWDFSELTEDGSSNIFDYIDPTGLPHADITVGTDVAEQLNSQTNGYFYFDNNGSTQWNRTGFTANDGGIELWFNYNYDSGSKTSLQLYPDNFTYQTTYDVVPFGANGGWYMDGIGEDEAIIPEAAEYHFDCDAYGTLILPHKVYLNAMRVHVTEDFQIQLLMGGSPAMTQTVSDDAYYWFVEGVQGAVLSYVVSTTSSKETSYTLEWQKPYDAIDVDFMAIDNVSGNSSTTGNTDDQFKMLNLSYPLNDGSTFAWEFIPNNVEYLEGTDATSANPVVRFTQPGSYTVTQTISNSNFTPDSQTETKTDYITITAAPELVADFTADNTSVATNGIVNFTSDISVSTGDPLQGTTTYQWAVSPGSNGVHWGFVNFTSNTSENPSIQFYQAGCYSIQLIATNSTYSNSPVTVTKMNYISAGGGCGTQYTATFTVTDGTNPISGANVSITGQGSATTNSSGIATFNLYNGTYNYSVSASGYETNSSSFTVSDANVPVDVVLVELTPYDAVFTVTDGINPITGATVTVTGQGSQTTDGYGVATFSLYDGSYSYTVDAIGYDSGNGNFTINAGNEAIPVVLTATEYTITFNVTDGTTAINSASITVDGYSAITTDANGDATIDLVNGDYDFDVTATGFNNYSSSFTVNGMNDDVDVVMTPLGLKENNISLLIYPNPSTGIINVVSQSPTSIRIISPSGVVVYQGEIVSSGQIDMSNFPKGLYFINYEYNGENKFHKIIIK